MQKLAWGAGVGGIATSAWWWLRARRMRQERRALLESTRTQLGFASRPGFPATSIDGVHCSYPFSLQCTPEQHEVLWKIHTELTSDFHGHLLVHGDERPSKMRELYGMEFFCTGDAEFDRLFVVACHDEHFARRLYAPFLRARFVALGGAHLQIEIDNRGVYAELIALKNPQGSVLPAVVDLLATLCGMVDAMMMTHAE